MNPRLVNQAFHMYRPLGQCITLLRSAAMSNSWFERLASDSNEKDVPSSLFVVC